MQAIAIGRDELFLAALVGKERSYNSLYFIVQTDLGPVLLVIPVAVVHPLPEELHWRYGAALVLLRQVEVVNQDDALLPHCRSIDALPPAIQLGHDHIWRILLLLDC